MRVTALLAALVGASNCLAPASQPSRVEPACVANAPASVEMFGHPVTLDQFAFLAQDGSVERSGDDAGGPQHCIFEMTDYPACSEMPAVFNRIWVGVPSCEDGVFSIGGLDGAAVHFRRRRADSRLDYNSALLDNYAARSGRVELHDCSKDGCTVVVDVQTERGASRACFGVTKSCP